MLLPTVRRLSEAIAVLDQITSVATGRKKSRGVCFAPPRFIAWILA